MSALAPVHQRSSESNSKKCGSPARMASRTQPNTGRDRPCCKSSDTMSQSTHLAKVRTRLRKVRRHTTTMFMNTSKLILVACIAGVYSTGIKKTRFSKTVEARYPGDADNSHTMAMDGSRKPLYYEGFYLGMKNLVASYFANGKGSLSPTKWKQFRTKAIGLAKKYTFSPRDIKECLPFPEYWNNNKKIMEELKEWEDWVKQAKHPNPKNTRKFRRAIQFLKREGRYLFHTEKDSQGQPIVYANSEDGIENSCTAVESERQRSHSQHHTRDGKRFLPNEDYMLLLDQKYQTHPYTIKRQKEAREKRKQQAANRCKRINTVANKPENYKVLDQYIRERCPNGAEDSQNPESDAIIKEIIRTGQVAKDARMARELERKNEPEQIQRDADSVSCGVKCLVM